MIKLIQHIALLGGDADGLTRKDRDAIRQRWRKDIAEKDIEAALAVFKDLTVTLKEKKTLLGLGNSLCSIAPNLLKCTLKEQKINHIIGRFGRRVRERHMVAMLKKAYGTKNLRKQLVILKELDQMKPRHEISLFPLLRKLYGNPKTDPRAALLVRKIYTAIIKNQQITDSNMNDDLASFIRYVPSLTRSKRIMLRCMQENSECLRYAAPSLLSDRDFINKAFASLYTNVFPNVCEALRHLAIMPQLDAIRLVDDVLHYDPSCFKFAVPFLKQVDPIRAYITVSEVVEKNPDAFFSGALQFIRAVDKEKALKWGLAAASKNKEAFHEMLPWIKKMSSTQASATALTLIKNDISALSTVLPFLKGGDREEARSAIKRHLFENLSVLPASKKMFSDAELEKLFFVVLKTTYSRGEAFDFEGYPEEALWHIAAFLRKGQKSSDAHIRGLANRMIKNDFSNFPLNLFIMTKEKAGAYLIHEIAGFYKKAKHLEHSVVARENTSGWGYVHFNFVARHIPKYFLSIPAVQRALLKENHNEIAWLIQHRPNVSINRKVKTKYTGLVRHAQKLGITTLTRIHTTTLLCEIIKNRRNIDKADGRPLALAIYSHADPYGSFKFNDLEKLTKYYRVVYFEVNSASEWLAAFERATRSQRATILNVGGHGRRMGILIGNNKGLTRFHVKKLSNLRDRMVPNGHIILRSCNMGNGKRRGYDLSTIISDTFPRVFVHAAVGLEGSGSSGIVFDPSGRLVRVVSNVERVIRHGNSRMVRTVHGRNYPRTLFPDAGWDDPRRKITAIEYRDYMRRKGYVRGVQLYPKRFSVPTRERFLLDRHF